MNKEPLVVMCGGMAAGKDVIGLHIAQNQQKPTFHFSFATPLKDEVNQVLQFLKESSHSSKIAALSAKFHIEPKDAMEMLVALNGSYLHYPDVNARSRTPEMRQALQVWGTGIRRKQNPDHWVNLAKTAIQEKLKKGYFVYITDGRFTNEFEVIKSLNGVSIVLNSTEPTRINRIEKRDGIRPSADALNHASEQDWKTYQDFDIVIDNDQQSEEETKNEALTLYQNYLTKEGKKKDR